MYKLIATLAALFLLGGCIAPASATTTYTTSFETVVTAITTGDSPALNIITTNLSNESIIKRPPNHGLGNNAQRNAKRWIFW